MEGHNASGKGSPSLQQRSVNEISKTMYPPISRALFEPTSTDNYRVMGRQHTMVFQPTKRRIASGYVAPTTAITEM